MQTFLQHSSQENHWDQDLIRHRATQQCQGREEGVLLVEQGYQLPSKLKQILQSLLGKEHRA